MKEKCTFLLPSIANAHYTHQLGQKFFFFVNSHPCQSQFSIAPIFYINRKIKIALDHPTEILRICEFFYNMSIMCLYIQMIHLMFNINIPLPVCPGVFLLSEEAGTKSGSQCKSAPQSQSVWICWISGTSRFWMSWVSAVYIAWRNQSAIFSCRADGPLMTGLFQIYLTPLDLHGHWFSLKNKWIK